MINKSEAIKIATKLLEVREFLIQRLGKNFEREIMFYEFLENTDPEIIEAIEFFQPASWALRRFLQEQDSVPNVGDAKVRQLLEALAQENLDSALDPAFWHDQRIEELEDPLLWQWWGPRDYVQAYLLAKPLISVNALPARLQELVSEARKCYAFGQENSVIALGRMILETALTDVGEKVGIFKSNRSLEDSYRDYPLWKRADDLLNPGSPRRREFKRLYDAGSSTIHSNESAEKIEPLTFLRDVLKFVSDEYAILANTRRAS